MEIRQHGCRLLPNCASAAGYLLFGLLLFGSFLLSVGGKVTIGLGMSTRSSDRILKGMPLRQADGHIVEALKVEVYISERFQVKYYFNYGSERH